MKRTVVLLLGLVLLLSIAACGKSKAVTEVENAIEEIGEVTIDSEEVIAKAEKLYNILTDSEKSDVSNRLTLAEAKDKFEQLQNEQKAKLAEEEAAAYKAKLWDLYYATVNGAAMTETAGNLIIAVWRNAIWEERDDKTDKYTRPDGYFVSDFNDALDNLFSDRSFMDSVDAIRINKDVVLSYIKDLQNPPEELKEAYIIARECYDAYITFTDLVINLSGSLQSFSESFEESSMLLYKKYGVLEMYLD
ncbi:MAG: hypothetical protein IJU78_01375 [Clostridia bacterium]|nr:hypothetical protein [Clostridia bacterium]